MSEEDRSPDPAEGAQTGTSESGDTPARTTTRRVRRAAPRRARSGDEQGDLMDAVADAGDDAAGAVDASGGGGDADGGSAESGERRQRSGSRRGSGSRAVRQARPATGHQNGGEDGIGSQRDQTDASDQGRGHQKRSGGHAGPSTNGASGGHGHGGQGHGNRHNHGGHHNGHQGSGHQGQGGASGGNAAHHTDPHDDDDDDDDRSGNGNAQDRGHDRGRNRGRGRGGDDRRNGGRGRPTSGWMGTLAHWIDNPQSQPNTIKGHGCDQGVQQLEELGCEAFLVDLSGARSREEVMDAFGRGMKLAAGYNEHWDAFEEAIFPPKGQDKPRVIVLRGFHALRRRDSFLADVLFDVLETVANTPNGGFRGVVYCR